MLGLILERMGPSVAEVVYPLCYLFTGFVLLLFNSCTMYFCDQWMSRVFYRFYANDFCALFEVCPRLPSVDVDLACSPRHSLFSIKRERFVKSTKMPVST